MSHEKLYNNKLDRYTYINSLGYQPSKLLSNKIVENMFTHFIEKEGMKYDETEETRIAKVLHFDKASVYVTRMDIEIKRFLKNKETVSELISDIKRINKKREIVVIMPYDTLDEETNRNKYIPEEYRILPLEMFVLKDVSNTIFGTCEISTDDDIKLIKETYHCNSLKDSLPKIKTTDVVAIKLNAKRGNVIKREGFSHIRKVIDNGYFYVE